MNSVSDNITLFVISALLGMGVFISRLWMFISFDSKRNEPKKTAGYVTFCERQYGISCSATQTFLMPAFEVIVAFVRL